MRTHTPYHSDLLKADIACRTLGPGGRWSGVSGPGAAVRFFLNLSVGGATHGGNAIAADAAEGGSDMKTLKTLTSAVLAASLCLTPLGSAWAFGHERHLPGLGPCDRRPELCRSIRPGGGTPPLPAPPAPAPSAPEPSVDSHHDHDDGATWGALAGGTILGMVMSSAASQSQQDTQPKVVVVQQPDEDTTSREAELELEIERERAKARALELELERLRAERGE